MAKRAGEGFLPAAEKILRRAGKPLTCREIVDRAIQAGLLDSAGKTPEKTLYALLYRHLQSEGANCKFKKVGPGRYDLRKR